MRGLIWIFVEETARYERNITQRDIHLYSIFIYAVERFLRNVGPDFWNDAWADCLAAVGQVIRCDRGCKSELHLSQTQGL